MTAIDVSALDAQAEEAATFLKSLANPVRLKILCTLVEGECSVGALAERAGLLGESRRPAAANNPGACPFPKNSSISSTASPIRSPLSPSASSPSG